MPGHGVSSLTVTGADDALLLAFGGACSKGGHVTVALGVAGLNFFLGVALFLFSVVSLFSNIRISLWEWGPKLANWCWDYWSHLVFHFQESFHLFDNCGVWAEFSGPRYAPNQLGCSIPSENVHPLH